MELEENANNPEYGGRFSSNTSNEQYSYNLSTYPPNESHDLNVLSVPDQPGDVAVEECSEIRSGYVTKSANVRSSGSNPDLGFSPIPQPYATSSINLGGVTELDPNSVGTMGMPQGSYFDFSSLQPSSQFLADPSDSHFESFDQVSFLGDSHFLATTEPDRSNLAMVERVPDEQPQISTGTVSLQKPDQPLSAKTIDSCIQRLAELSAGLMRNLGSLNTCKMVTSFLFTQSNQKTADYLSKTLDESTGINTAGPMLQGVETFLEILQDLKKLLTSSKSVNMQSDLNMGDDSTPNFTSLPSEASAEERMEDRWNIIQSYLERAKAPSTISPSPINSTNQSSSPHTLKLDVPAILTVLNCYICILKIFDSVFSAILYTLDFSPDAEIFKKLPPMMSGLQIDGFSLSSRNLQIKVLVQVSSHMLDSIEQALELDSPDKNSNSGIFAGSMLQALLQTMLEEEGLRASEESLSGMKTARDLIRRVDELMRKIV